MSAPASAAPASITKTEGAQFSLRSFLALDQLDNRYPSLHGLRVIAILSVIQFHVTWIFAGEQGISIDHDFMTSSLTIFFGMDLVFMLSGVLIGSILLRALEVSGHQQIRRFYIRRVFRTFPSYYVVLTYLALTTALSSAQQAHLRYEYIYATNFMPLGRSDILMFWGWSLALEEQFYLVVPALFFVLHRIKDHRVRIGLLCAVWIVPLIIRLVIYYRWVPWTDLKLYSALYFRTHTRFDTLVAGIILAFVHQRYKEGIKRWLEDPFHRAIVAVPSLALMWLLLQPWAFGEKNVQLVHVFAWGTITSLMWFGFLILLLHAPAGWIARSLSQGFWRKIATLGYGVYLVHIPICDRLIVPIAHSAEKHGVPMLVIWPIALVALSALSLGLAYIMHVLIEKPSLKIREILAA